MSNNFVILIPARGGSQRISKKNIESFAISSLLEIKLNQARRVLGDSGDIILNNDSKEYLEKYSVFKSLTTVTSHKEYLWINNKPINDNPDYHPRSKDLPESHTLNFTDLILKIKEMKKRRNIITESPKFFPLDNIESFDTDEEWQYELAEKLFLSINQN